MQKIPFLQYMLAVLEKEKGYTKQTNKQTKIQPTTSCWTCLKPGCPQGGTGTEISRGFGDLPA
ncbi:hypothetical protein, partial [Thiolapillus sp.]|uniref:hypothetical protein n=1 Tax=Thiolapillus sp. TaxID=2017437 RepID=UPI003AF85DC6